MANALGTLFGDIASAIREKTGDTATMKPAQFPEKIAAIEAGGGSGGLKGKHTSVTLNGTYGERVSVDFGFTPGMILLYPNSNVNVSSSNYMLAVGINNDFSEIMGTGYRQRNTYIYQSKTTTQSTGTSIDTTSANYPFYNADKTGFNLGKTFAAGNYYVYALGL